MAHIDSSDRRTSMTATAAALDVAKKYYQAWTTKDIDTAMSYVADDIVCDAPAGRISGVDDYRAFLAPFAGMLISTDLIASFGDDTTAVLIYDTQTPPVASAPGAECVTVEDGKIIYSRFIFDRLPFDQARR